MATEPGTEPAPASVWHETQWLRRGCPSRGWWHGRTIYSVGGSQCVELELRNGRIVALGSRRADELAAAVRRYL